MKKQLIKYSITHKRSDDLDNSYWAAYIWSENFLSAYEIAGELEKLIPLVYDIKIDGVYFEKINVDIQLESMSNGLLSLVPWFIYYQLDEYIETEKDLPDLYKMLEYFIQIEEFEICADLKKKIDDYNKFYF